MQELLDRVRTVGPHEWQVAMTVTMIVTAALMALLCDVLRYRLSREALAQTGAGPQSEVAPLRTAIARTLIPEDVRPEHDPGHNPEPAPLLQPATQRASRLAMALKQERRAPSPAAQAVIARGQEAAQAVISSLPSGFHGREVLERATDASVRVTGLTMAVAVANHKKGSRAPEVCRTALESLLGPGDFAAPASENEFVVVVPNLQGVEAEQRMRRMTRQVWDLQVRSLSHYGVSFQAGGLEVHDEPLGDAVAKAMERMHSAPRRKPVTKQRTRAASQAG